MYVRARQTEFYLYILKNYLQNKKLKNNTVILTFITKNTQQKPDGYKWSLKIPNKSEPVYPTGKSHGNTIPLENARSELA